MIWFLAGCWCAAMALSWARWLRVAQREHYLAGSVLQFARTWSVRPWMNAMLTIAALVSVVLTNLHEAFGVITMAIVAGAPVGLGIRGRTSPLKWTRRLRVLAGATLVVTILLTVVLGVGIQRLGFVLALTAVASPIFVELGLLVTRPYENARARTFIAQARKKLGEVHPCVVGITGSYGKTTTKGYVQHFLAGSRRVLASPASYNNRAGLCRAINEHLTAGIEVFVAEMGTYGKGEIRELCSFCPPTIAVFTAIGPVHLERFGTEEKIIEAKAEIFEHASTCVTNVDDPRLEVLAATLEGEGKTVWRVSDRDTTRDVCVLDDGKNLHVIVRGSELGEIVQSDAPPVNVACAVAVALACGLDQDAIRRRFASPLPVPQHRQEISTLPNGVMVIDDTFNANPASVRKGIALLNEHATAEGARRIVVTPGMVELGKRQYAENEAFGRAIAQGATDLVIVGKTNAAALHAGTHASALRVVSVPFLPDAVSWVREHAKAGDVVLYANDLPDHYA